MLVDRAISSALQSDEITNALAELEALDLGALQAALTQRAPVVRDAATREEESFAQAIRSLGTTQGTGDDWARASDEYAFTRQALLTKLTEAGALAEARELANLALGRAFSSVLNFIGAEGLSQASDRRYEVPTTAASQLEQVAQGMPGGSIGIAGARGAGKSTLLRIFTEGRSAPSGGHRSRPFLATVVEAPVQYDAREFILEVFASTCSAALRGTHNRFDTRLITGPDDRLDQTTRVMGMLLGLGAIVASGSYALDLVLPSVLAVAGALGVSMAAVQLWRLRPLRWPRSSQLSPSRPEPVLGPPHATRLAARARAELEMIRFQQSFSSGYAGTLKLPFALEGSASRARTLAHRQMSYPQVVAAFRDFLTFAANPPTGSDASQGRLQPDRRNTIRIGIDELDKVASPESAWAFLNEIKSIFGVEGCFFAVSVSDDAMSAFERRGLPFRDAFESAFDEMVRVAPLSLEETQRLLARRIIGLPSPYSALVHCLGGGLPREAIRWARRLVRLRDAEGAALPLGLVCRHVVCGELNAQADALGTGSHRGGQGGAPLTVWLRSLASLDATADLLLGASPPSLGPEERLAGEERVPLLVDLSRQLQTYVNFLGTLLAVFRDQLTEDEFTSFVASHIKGGSLDDLARARHTLGLDLDAGWDMLSTFRRCHGL